MRRYDRYTERRRSPASTRAIAAMAALVAAFPVALWMATEPVFAGVLAFVFTAVLVQNI